MSPWPETKGCDVQGGEALDGQGYFSAPAIFAGGTKRDWQ